MGTVDLDRQTQSSSRIESCVGNYVCDKEEGIMETKTKRFYFRLADQPYYYVYGGP